VTFIGTPSSNNKRKKTKRRTGRRKQRTKAGRRESAEQSKPKQGIGSQIGSTLGNFAEGAIKSLFGSGDYSEEWGKAGGFEVGENTIVEPEMAAQVPVINGLPAHEADQGVRIRHREYLGEQKTTDAGSIVSIFRINPTDPLTFPWLSRIAARFEQWKALGVVFEFVSTSGSAIAGTSAALGSLSMATQYDSHSPVFANKIEMLNHYFATSGGCDRNQMHAIECDPSESQVSIFWTEDHSYKPGPPIVSGDQNLDTLGWFYTRAQGSPGGYVIGELWVTYDIILLKPKLPPTLPGLPSVGDLYREEHPDRYSEMKESELLETPPSEDWQPIPPNTPSATAAKLQSHFSKNALRVAALTR